MHLSHGLTRLVLISIVLLSMLLCRYEEMEVSSNDLVWRIRQAYVRQSSSSESTRFLITLGDDRILQELDDSKELCEYKIGPTSPVYASTNLKTGDEMVLVD